MIKELEMLNLKKGRHRPEQKMWKGFIVVFKYVTFKLHIKGLLRVFWGSKAGITRSPGWKVQGSTFWLNIL